MRNIFFADNSLRNFIKKSSLKEDDKNFILSKLPLMDLAQRIKLFRALTDIYLLDLEEKESLEKIKRFKF